MLSLKNDPLTTARNPAECPTGCSSLRHRAVHTAQSPQGSNGQQTWTKEGVSPRPKEGFSPRPGSLTIRGSLGFATTSSPDSHPAQITVGHIRSAAVAGIPAEGSFPAPTSRVFPVLTYCLHLATQGTRALRAGINRNLTYVFLRAIKHAHNYEHYLSHVLPISITFKIQEWHNSKDSLLWIHVCGCPFVSNQPPHLFFPFYWNE